MSDKKFATMSWSPEDVQTLFNIDRERAEEWLQDNQKYIVERLVELGWGVIEDLGLYDELPISEQNPSEPWI